MDRRRPGFTLVETLLVLALAGMFALAATVSIRRLGPALQLRAGAWQVTSGLNQARFRAILSGTDIRVRFVPAGFVLERYDQASATWRPARAVVLPGVRLRANNAPVFHPQGTVTGLATIIVDNARGGYRITVAITGRIRSVRTD